MRGRALFFPFDEDLHRDGGRRSLVEPEGAERGRVDHDPALVVRGASPVHPTVTHDGFERRGCPPVGGPLRLDVVMGVEQEARSPVRAGALSERRRMTSLELEEPGVGKPGSGQDVASGLG